MEPLTVSIRLFFSGPRKLRRTEPFTVEATIEEISEADGNPVLTAKSTEGDTYKVVVPPDVTLDADAGQIFNQPDCAGKVLADLELVAAPDHEEAGDHILVSAKIDTESCLERDTAG